MGRDLPAVGVFTVTATVMAAVAATTEAISKQYEGGELMRKSNDPGAWNPYVAGALTGLVSIGSVWVAGKYFGASTTFVRGTGFLEKFFDPAKVAKMEYFIKEKPIIDWQWMFVVGILIGAFIAAASSGSFRLQAVPDMWNDRFGQQRGQAGRRCVCWRNDCDVWGAIG